VPQLVVGWVFGALKLEDCSPKIDCGCGVPIRPFRNQTERANHTKFPVRLALDQTKRRAHTHNLSQTNLHLPALKLICVILSC
jgi:hypothetical protein